MTRFLAALLALLIAAPALANDYYTHGSFPTTGSAATSAGMRAELDLISAGFDKFPTLTGNGSKALVVNGGGTAVTLSTGTLTLGGNLSIASNFTISGAYATTLTVTGATGLTLPTTGTLSTLAGAESLSNKTLPSPVFSGSITGTYTLAGTPTITGATINTATIATPTFSGNASGSLTGFAATNAVLTTSTVAANPTAALGIASKQYVDALWTTGDVKLTMKTTADSGWLLMNDGTIGNASSGGTTRANADTEDLFTLLWTNCANADCAVSTGRGASAAEDYAANKTIALPKALGRALATYGAGAGLTSRALGAVTGAEDAVVVSHTHTATVTDPGHIHALAKTFGGAIDGGGAGSNEIASAGSTNVGSATTGVTVANSTEGVAATDANMQPTLFLNIMIKL